MSDQVPPAMGSDHSGQAQPTGKLTLRQARAHIEKEIDEPTWEKLGVGGKSAMRLMFKMIPDVELFDFRLIPMYDDEKQVNCVISLIVTEKHVYYTRIHKGTIVFRTIPIERFNVTVKVEYSNGKLAHAGLVCDVGDQHDDGRPNLHPIELPHRWSSRVADVVARINVLRENGHAKKTHFEKLQGIRDPKIQSRIFLVHGRNKGPLREVQLLLERQDLPHVVLAEEGGIGKPIIDNLEEQAEKTTFAIVLLTPDDRGGLATDLPGTYKPRARQNVIFELGYFIGRLKSKHVCPILVDEVEKPSNYDGVVYVPYDAAGAWKQLLAKALERAEFVIDYGRL